MKFASEIIRIRFWIPQVASIEEVELNVTAIEKGPLPEEILKHLDEITSMVPFRPCEEPFVLPFNSTYYGPGPLR